MAQIVELTQLSPTMTEGTFVKWTKKAGDAVSPGDVMAEVETDKAVMEMEAYDDGIILVLLAKEGDRLPVGAPIAIVGAAGEDVHTLIDDARARLEKIKAGGATASSAPTPATPTAAQTAPATSQPSAPAQSAAPAAETQSTGTSLPPATAPSSPQLAPQKLEPGRHGRIIASPLAKKMAEDKGVDLHRVKGTGPGGRIVKEDVLAALRGGSTSSAVMRRPDKRVDISQMRRVIASRLHDAKNNIPHFYLTLEFNAMPLVSLREKINHDLASIAGKNDEPFKVTYNDLIVKAVALTLGDHPICNSSWRGDHIMEHGRVDIGIAVAVDGGLITPYVRDADQMQLVALAQKVRELTKKARDRKLKPEEFTDGTFTISNLGMFGISSFSAIINEPEAGLLAVGGLVEKAVVENGALVPGKTMTVTLSCDHRVIDGAAGAAFLQTFQKYVENPHVLLMR
ncbi:MAG: 2-oxo acid dehydrogenase subunit E2 [Leptospirales bacterium]|nr:2-oxo acid dehydrogenase subunit E2 [Leptospirales bacterium]